MQNKRILIAKVGLDGHDRGALIVMSYLKDNGFDVIYSGLHATPSQIVEIAAQEDVAAIGISVLSGSHLESVSRIAGLVSEFFSTKILIFAGGVIPLRDHEELIKCGVDRVFRQEERLEEIVSWLVSELTMGRTH
jgi:methylmalonyl-CoA mutase C-terminal domain/subunit